MEVRIDSRGDLLIKRGSEMKRQGCPYGISSNTCGDWCPHFYITADDPDAVVVDLCRTQYLLTKEDGDIFVDEREQFMKLISCESCGAVLDMDRIEEPDMYEGDEGGYGDTVSISDKKSLYKYGGYVPAINCPVCKTLISYSTGEC